MGVGGDIDRRTRGRSARFLMVVAVLAVLAVLAAGCGGSGGFQVVRVSTFPWPEGPPVVAATKPVPGSVPLSEIQDAIPKTLPKNPAQTCNIGAKVQIALRGGRVVTYGPCDWPASIERLRLALIRASQQRH
jgi:hypothetical protein